MIKFLKSTIFNKRSLKRFEISLNLKFKIVSGEDPSETSTAIGGITKSISLDGLTLKTGVVQTERLHISHDRSMMIKNNLDIELELPIKDKRKKADTIHILGRVAWYDKQEPNTEFPFHVGVELLEISDDNRSKLKALIKR